jgi:four helix bundle protein
MSHKFRELVVWQPAMTLVTEAYTLTRKFPPEEQFGLTSQLRRAAVSIALNIAEGAGSDSPQEFRRFLSIALRSTYETMTALELSQRLHYCDDAQVRWLLDECDQIAAMITGLAKRLQEHAQSKSVRESMAEYEIDPLSASILSDYRLLTTDDSLVVREASVTEVSTIVALIHAAFKEYDRALDPPSGAHKETEEQIRQKMVTDRAALALVDGCAVACVLYRDEGDHVYFGRLAVHPAYRKRGISAKLIAYIEARAAELGHRRVRLGVRIALPQLRARYERLGYRVIEERCHAGYNQPTYVVMEKLIQ